MSILNSMLNAGLMGEPQRLDYVIRAHDLLQARVDRLTELLRSKGLITAEELSALEAAADDPERGQIA